MKSIASQRNLVWLMIVTTGMLPACLPIACLSGAEQENLQNAWVQTFTGLVSQQAAAAAPRDVPGDGGILDALWNGGVDWSIGLATQAVNAWFARQIDWETPDDPFDFP